MPGWEPVRASPGGAGHPSAPRCLLPGTDGTLGPGPPCPAVRPALVTASGGGELGEPSPCRQGPLWALARVLARLCPSPGRPSPLPAEQGRPGWPCPGPALARPWCSPGPDPCCPAAHVRPWVPWAPPPGEEGLGVIRPALGSLAPGGPLRARRWPRPAPSWSLCLCTPNPQAEWLPPPWTFVFAFASGTPASPPGTEGPGAWGSLRGSPQGLRKQVACLIGS